MVSPEEWQFAKSLSLSDVQAGSRKQWEEYHPWIRDKRQLDGLEVGSELLGRVASHGPEGYLVHIQLQNDDFSKFLVDDYAGFVFLGTSVTIPEHLVSCFPVTEQQELVGRLVKLWVHEERGSS
eukprot:5359103-Amphidinium_carterae.1